VLYFSKEYEGLYYKFGLWNVAYLTFFIVCLLQFFKV
jgi:hypothetical protein